MENVEKIYQEFFDLSKKTFSGTEFSYKLMHVVACAVRDGQLAAQSEKNIKKFEETHNE